MIRALPLLVLLGACVTETGNPELVDVELRAAATSASGKAAVAAGTRVTTAWVLIGDVRLVEGTTCDAPGEIEHTAEGPFETDLLAGSPEAIHIDASASSYCRLRVRLDKADGVAEAPAALDDHSVLLEGVRADGTPFEIRSRAGFEAELRSRGEPFTIDAGRDQLLLAFDLDTWLGGVDLAGAEVGDDGTVTVDEDHNRDQLDQFEDQLEAVMALHADASGDGELDADDDVLAD